MQITFTLETISRACEQVWAAGQSYNVWAFYGEMGAGKTTFIHNLCEFLGTTSTVSSPTYSIINEYESAKAGVIYHMDWYRLNTEVEAIEAGVEECLYSKNLCLVEWPEKAKALLPDRVFNVVIKLINGDERVVGFGG